jgi:hypothetical protein
LMVVAMTAMSLVCSKCAASGHFKCLENESVI